MLIKSDDWNNKEEENCVKLKGIKGKRRGFLYTYIKASFQLNISHSHAILLPRGYEIDHPISGNKCTTHTNPMMIHANPIYSDNSYFVGLTGGTHHVPPGSHSLMWACYPNVSRGTSIMPGLHILSLRVLLLAMQLCVLWLRTIVVAFRTVKTFAGKDS